MTLSLSSPNATARAICASCSSCALSATPGAQSSSSLSSPLRDLRLPTALPLASPLFARPLPVTRSLLPLTSSFVLCPIVTMGSSCSSFFSFVALLRARFTADLTPDDAACTRALEPITSEFSVTAFTARFRDLAVFASPFASALAAAILLSSSSTLDISSTAASISSSSFTFPGVSLTMTTSESDPSSTRSTTLGSLGF
mmetsp:Transcript_1629/g.7251  ORF Transcript_1629/g.7251 Transcript_1629/m.7251 type:complete len:200 (-) Transcript_1629:7498-8097(-)